MVKRTITLVIPVLDEAATLPAALAALQPLRRDDVEIIVVDGGSSDGTAELAHASADRVLSSPRGRSTQMNIGGRHARGDWLLFLHIDTRLPSGAIDAIRAAVDGGARWGRFDVRIDSAAPLLRLVGWAMNVRSRLTGIATGDQAIFVERALFEAIGGFPEQPLMEDIALSAKLNRLARPVCLRAIVATSARRWESNGIIRTIVLMWILRARFFFGADPHDLAVAYGYRPAKDGARMNRHNGDYWDNWDSAVDVAIFAKAPRPGFAKTRLIPALGAFGAARLQRRLTLRTIATASRFSPNGVTLWCAPDTRARFFRALARRYAIELATQSDGELGERMHRAFVAHGGPLLLIGTDCPALTGHHLVAAEEALRNGNDAVFIPAEDGGYVLVGLRCPCPEAFRDIAWSTAHVMAQTRQRLRDAGLRWKELDPLWDIDRPADLARLERLDE